MQQLLRLSAYWLPLAVFAGVFLFGSTLSSAWERSPDRLERQEARQQAEAHAEQLEAELWRSLAALEVLALLWAQQPQPLSRLARYETAFYQRYGTAIAVRLRARDGSTLLLSRAATAARLLANLNPSAPPEGRLQLEPVELTPGEPALLAQQAIAPGHIDVLLSLDDLLAASQIDQLAAAGYRYELSVQSSGQRRIVQRSSSPLLQPVEISFRFAQQTWTLALTPAEGWQYPSTASLAQLWLLLTSTLLALLTFFLLKQPELLQQEVAKRTRVLHAANQQLASDCDRQQAAQAACQQEMLTLQHEHRQLQQQIETLQRLLQARQAQLMQSETMASLGRLVSGAILELESPANFIYGNLDHAHRYVLDLLHLVDLYQARYPQPDPELQQELDTIDLTFVRSDLPSLLTSLQVSARRIREVMRSLRSFSLNDTEMQATDLHASIEGALLILQSRLHGKAGQPDITIRRHYGKLPPIVCYPNQLEQAIVNLLANAIDALGAVQGQREIAIQTALEDRWAAIRIRDNGPGIPRELQPRLFEPFFTTKPAGRGTGLGLAICRQIVVERHQGELTCRSEPGEGAEFTLAIPSQVPPPLAEPVAEEQASATPLAPDDGVEFGG